ncbi:hypothetical protein TCAL_11884 [Tigriopus californicus]|uniref:C-type lectin domain-containing protein n=1 Tax=Tigriopus californicus TaxID=6832 RepID=A0A553NYM6_TIGCA|nr:uncharacterized protein LOC131887369 [Tigriopus californicus]TRY70537.1 hypothetical protein TCAL_11884 [Tigriopus californicus]|eukprot:TCALIF_11884-PA protein Name:"Protein of unknown function" AED:0.00 eAED:0.00 QI:149/1/1/1/1/1/3/184/325
MKLFWLLMLVPAWVGATDKRLCPEGYRYGGEDTPEHALNKSGNALVSRDIWYEEADRSPVYSCYKVIGHRKSWLEAMHQCWDDDAQLVSTEDNFEIVRIVRLFFSEHPNPPENGLPDEPRSKDNNAFFTSGLYQYDVKEWKWLGSENDFRDDLEINQDLHNGIGGGTQNEYRDCLALTQDGPSLHLTAVPCNYENQFICEARVQTVTYYTWFVANWVDFLLGFLLIILFVSLCVSLCSFSSTKTHRGQTGPIGRRPRTTDPNSQFAVGTVDMPPSYETTVKIHRPDEQASELPAKLNNGNAPQTRMEQIQNRGREVMGKLYIYRK